MRIRKIKLQKDDRKYLEKKLLDLWSKIVRLKARGRCEYCNSNNVVQAHHIVPKTHKGTKWDIDNGVALCVKHHLYWAHKAEPEYYDWIKTKRNMDLLKLKGYATARFTVGELEILLADMEHIYSDLTMGNKNNTI